MESQNNKLVRPAALEVLKEVLENMSVINYSMKISNGTEKGHNLAGILAQVEVNGYDRKGKKVQHNFMLKSIPEQGILKECVFLKESYYREIYVYSNLLPTFVNIQKERQITNYFDSYPTYYTSCQILNQECIILENMKTNGYKHWNRKIPTDINHVSLVVRELGRFHALSYAIRDQKPDLFKEIVNNTQEAFFQNFSKDTVRNSTIDRVNKVLQTLDPIKDKNVYNKYKQFADNSFAVLSKCIDSAGADNYAVVNHGDCSISNFMFKYDSLGNPNVPTQLCFLDWQMSRIGSPVLDLTCFIFSCTNKEFRDNHYNDVISEYYSSLGCLLKELGSEVEKMLPFTIFKEQLEKYSIFGLFMATLLLFIQFSDDEEIPDFSNVLPENINNSFIYNISNIDYFNSTVRDLVLDFDKLGYNFL